jgi:hypothetical protein
MYSVLGFAEPEHEQHDQSITGVEVAAFDPFMLNHILVNVPK